MSKKGVRCLAYVAAGLTLIFAAGCGDEASRDDAGTDAAGGSGPDVAMSAVDASSVAPSDAAADQPVASDGEIFYDAAPWPDGGPRDSGADLPFSATYPCFPQGIPPSGLPTGRGNCGPNPPADLCRRLDTPMPDPTCTSGPEPVVLWCSSPTDIWAAQTRPSGDRFLVRWDGQRWTSFLSDYGDHFWHAAWGRAANDVWIVGHAGHVSWAHTLVVYHWDGTRLHRLQLPPAAPGHSVNPDIQVWIATVSATPAGEVWVSAAFNYGWRIPNPLPAGCLVDP